MKKLILLLVLVLMGALASAQQRPSVHFHVVGKTYSLNDIASVDGVIYKVGVASTTNTPPHADWTDITAGFSLAGHNVTELDDVSDAGSGLIITGVERTKLAGIETGATADQTLAEVLSTGNTAGTFIDMNGNQILGISSFLFSGTLSGDHNTDSGFGPGVGKGGQKFISGGVRFADASNTNNLKMTYGTLTSLGTLNFTDSNVTYNGTSLFGDLLSTNNLSDVASPSLSLENLSNSAMVGPFQFVDANGVGLSASYTTERVSMVGGIGANQVSLRVDSNEIRTDGYSNAEIDLIGGTSIITKDYGDANYAGDVVGPGSATNEAIARFDTTTGKLIQNSSVEIDDSGNVTEVNTLALTDGTVMSWNTDFKTLNIPTGLGPILQAGQEQYIVFYNDTGAQIDNGTVMRPVAGFLVGSEIIPTFEKALADSHELSEGTLVITTMDIPNGSVGICARFGRVSDINTDAWNLGDDLYLSPTVAGTITNVRPEFPDYILKIGGVVEKDISTGIVFFNQTTGLTDTFSNFHNGTFRESFDFTVASNGTIITGSLTPTNGHPDMTMMFSDGFTMFDTSPAATIVLTAGTDAVPVSNFVYILESAKVLAVSTSDWPTTEHIKVAKIILQSAATTQTDDALMNQNWNDHIESTTNFQGHLSHIAERMRQDASQWHTGTLGTSTLVGASTPDDVFVDVTSGSSYQLHLTSFDALDTQTGDFVHVINNSVTPYFKTSNLNTEILDATGASLNNKSFSFVLWATNNKSGEAEQLFINLPSGSYSFASPDDAVEDANGHSVYTIPNTMKSTSFLISRFTYTYKNDVWVLYDTEDLRGVLPNTSAGGGTGGGIQNFQNVYENSTIPQVTTDITRNEMVFQGGSGTDTDDVLEIRNNAGTPTAGFKADGDLLANNINPTGTVDGRDLVTDGTKLDGIEASAKDDQTASEVPIVDGGAIITATEVEGALQENRTAIDLNTPKITNANHTGDATGATALTLATVNSNVGSFTNADITVNAKGLITAAANGSASSLPVVDTTSLVEGSVDATKEGRIEVDTNVPTGTIVDVNWPSADLDLEDAITTNPSGRTNPIDVKKIYGQTQADFDTDGAPPADEFVILTDAKVTKYISIPFTAQGGDVVVGTSLNSQPYPVAITITDVWATVLTAGTTSVITVDINEDDGTPATILSTKITIDATERSSSTAATPPVISDASFASFSHFIVDVDTADSGNTGATGTVIIAYTED